MATTLPSELKETELPEKSGPASPSMSCPTCTKIAFEITAMQTT